MCGLWESLDGERVSLFGCMKKDNLSLRVVNLEKIIPGLAEAGGNAARGAPEEAGDVPDGLRRQGRREGVQGRAGSKPLIGYVNLVLGSARQRRNASKGRVIGSFEGSFSTLAKPIFSID